MGGRLLAMANAKALADRLGYRFGFTWSSRDIIDQESHTVDVVGKIFSADFIDKHWLGETIKVADFGVLGGTAFAPSDLEAAARGGKLRGWICDDFDVLDFFRDQGVQPARSEALRAFGFAPAVRQALDAAGKCRFPGPMAALHLRSGDIVYGHHRRRLVFADKVIPSTLAKAVVSELSSKGLTTLLVGQDRATLDYVGAQTGAMRTDDFGAADFKGEEALSAFFEMALMARCQQIHAGNSIYAVVASVMGEVPCLDISALFSKPRATEIIMQELQAHQADYHPLEAAFGYQWSFLSLEDKIDPARARELLEKAQALDPENDAYDLKLAAAHFREGNYPAGEAMLKSLMISQSRLRSKIPLPMMDILTDRIGGFLTMARDFEVFFAAARAGYPYAMACSAYILLEVLEDRKSAMEMAARLVKIEPGNAIFRRIRRRIELGKKPKSGRLAKARWRLGRLKTFWI
ncbi:tetratricopeptide repeat protein [Mesorhizobium sp. NZP2298]|nr:tetratricopeptide repeat protein [Mesorhizobium sp. NZP2298]